MQELLSEEELNQLRAACVGAGFSGLTVAALRRVLRVAASAKMAPEAKTAIAAYVASTLLYVRRLQRSAHPVCPYKESAECGIVVDHHPTSHAMQVCC